MHCGLGSAPEARRTRGQASPGALQAAWVKDSHDNEEHNDDQRDVDGPFYLQYSVRGQGRSCKKPSLDVIAMLQVMREHRIMQHDFMNPGHTWPTTLWLSTRVRASAFLLLYTCSTLSRTSSRAANVSPLRSSSVQAESLCRRPALAAVLYTSSLDSARPLVLLRRFQKR